MIAAGTVMDVAYSTRWESLQLQAPRCPHCAVWPIVDTSIRNVTMVREDDLLGARKATAV